MSKLYLKEGTLKDSLYYNQQFVNGNTTFEFCHNVMSIVNANRNKKFEF